LIPLLARRFTVVALDLPGFGQSSIHASERYGLDEQVQRLRSFLQKLGINQSYLVGSSMGGNLALWYALEHPTEVLGLAVIAPATRPNLVPIMSNRWLWLSRPSALLINRWLMGMAHRRTVSKKNLVDRLRVEETFRTYGRNHAAVRSFLLATDSIRDPRLGTKLSSLQIQPLILWGAQDRLVPRSVINAMEAAVGAHESHVHATGGHHLQEDEPEWVAEKIDAFFAQHKAENPT
jgi:pimeloyl-ACP methyl ester carboxylesterase